MNNQNQQQIPPTQSQILTLPGISDLLKRTFSVYKARLGTFLGIMVLPVISGLLFLIPSAILKDIPVLGIFLFIIFWLAVVIINFWSYVSLIFAIKEREKKIGIAESFKKGWPKIISFVWISFLVGFITIGGFLLFIIPGIIFTIWFAFPVYVLVSEDLRGMNSLFRSKQLVAEYWWKILWRFLVMGIIILLFFGVLIGIAAGLILLFPSLIPFTDFAESVMRIISTLFITPFSVAFGFLLYEDLKKQKAQVAFEPPKKGTKIKFILIGIAGLLLVPAILASIVLVSLGGAREKAKDARIMANMQQMRVAAEIVYWDEENYSGVSCVHPELVSLCNDIKDLTGKEPIIHSSQETYCIYTKLLSGKYYCLDSSLGRVETAIFPGGLGYCDGKTFVCP